MENRNALSIVDPHIHLLNYSEGKYEWLKPKNAPHWPDKPLIARNVGIDELYLSNGLQLQGAVHIEAGFDNSQAELEIAWLEDIKQAKNTIELASIAYADLRLAHQNFVSIIKKLTKYQSVQGIRHIIDSDIEMLCSNAQVISNIAYLEQNDLLFELQFDACNSKHTAIIYDFFSQFPRLKLVLNHAGFAPCYKSNLFQAWQTNVRKLSLLPQLFVKCSGFEMVNRQYTSTQINSVFSECIKAFGQQRVMCASNYPLTTFSCSYQQYWEKVYREVSQLLNNNIADITDVMQKNASTLYKLRQ